MTAGPPFEPERRVPARGLAIGALAVGVLGTVVFAMTLTLPWRHPFFDVPVPVRIAMAAAGLLTLAIAIRAPRPGGVAAVTAVLGAGMLAYPSVLALQAWRPDDPAFAMAGATTHIPILICAQLVPVLAATRVSRRRHRWWEAAIVTLPLLSIACGVVAEAGVPALAPVGTTFWLASVVVVPLGAWSPLRRTTGTDRRRIVLAGIAATTPAVIVIWCQTLAAVAGSLGMDENLSISVLLLGMSAGGALSAFLSVAAGGTTSRLLAPGVLLVLCDLICGALALALGGFAALMATVSLASPIGAVLIGAGTAGIAGAIWLLIRRAVRRLVDPGWELRREMRTVGPVAEGSAREVAQLVLRKLSAEPTLTLVYVPTDSARTQATALGRRHIPLLTRPDGSVGVVAEVGHVAEDVRHVADSVAENREAEEDEALADLDAADASLRRRLDEIGDLTSLLEPALHEAELADARQRAALAADEERQRLTRNLHDGLQGRLLGLALNLQLTGDAIGDPGARLLLDETVGSLRTLVEDVRQLGGGDLPRVLALEGLEPAVRLLVAPLAPFVTVDITDRRLPPAVESTAYFVIGEAVTNALKHADAGHIEVAVSAASADRTSNASIIVRDDGRGGADPRIGSGLRGLAERVTAAGGVFVVRDGDAGGTIVEAVLPCDS